MNELTIYNVYVEMESQEQCDRMKQLCIDNNLYLEHDLTMFDKAWYIFEYCETYKTFGIWTSFDNKYQVTEEEFINLLKQTKRRSN